MTIKKPAQPKHGKRKYLAVLAVPGIFVGLAAAVTALVRKVRKGTQS